MVGSPRAQAFARCLMKDTVSSDHLPATSPANTTNLALRPGRTNSANVRSFCRLAATRTAPSTSAAPLCGDPSQCNDDTSVVSTASCAPPKTRRPSTTTSKRRPSFTGTGGRGRARTRLWRLSLLPHDRCAPQHSPRRSPVFTKNSCDSILVCGLEGTCGHTHPRCWATLCTQEGPFTVAENLLENAFTVLPVQTCCGFMLPTSAQRGWLHIFSIPQS